MKSKMTGLVLATAAAVLFVAGCASKQEPVPQETSAAPASSTMSGCTDGAANCSAKNRSSCKGKSM